jgi:hypothetical protein
MEGNKPIGRDISFIMVGICCTPLDEWFSISGSEYVPENASAKVFCTLKVACQEGIPRSRDGTRDDTDVRVRLCGPETSFVSVRYGYEIVKLSSLCRRYVD